MHSKLHLIDLINRRKVFEIAFVGDNYFANPIIAGDKIIVTTRANGLKVFQIEMKSFWQYLFGSLF